MSATQGQVCVACGNDLGRCGGHAPHTVGGRIWAEHIAGQHKRCHAKAPCRLTPKGGWRAA